MGFTSIGGGSLMTPILVFMGLSPATAVGTEFLVYSAVTQAWAALSTAAGDG